MTTVIMMMMTIRKITLTMILMMMMMTTMLELPHLPVLPSLVVSILEAEEEHSLVVQQAMGLLAFPTTTSIQPYKDLLDPGRWFSLITQFRSENFRLHQLSSQSTFTVALQSGLAALKTPQCYKHNFLLSGLNNLASLQDVRSVAVTEKNPECPVCDPVLNTLAHNLPFAHCSQSRLVCHMSGAALNENNQPMMLPNGKTEIERDSSIDRLSEVKNKLGNCIG